MNRTIKGILYVVFSPLIFLAAAFWAAGMLIKAAAQTLAKHGKKLVSSADDN